MDRVQTVVIGAGVVGLACARALAQAGHEVIILERENAFGTATSSRNSEVIHAGLYYPPGSARAQLCVRGRDLLYAFCERLGVAHQRCGKLVVGQGPQEEARLQALLQQGLANGVGDLRWLSGAEARALEPALHCDAALLSPSSGIVDAHGLMLALLGEAEAAGASLALCSPALTGRVVPGGFELEVGDGQGQPVFTLGADHVVNAAGLQACDWAAGLAGLDAAQVPVPRYAQGAYFSLRGAAPFRHLIYPVPGTSSHLGVHLTLDLGGQARFGPSFRWVDAVDYRVDPADGAGFEAAVRHYWPGLPDDALQPAYAGVRPKITGPGEPAADFRIDGPARHGVPGLVNLFGIESPGLTASLAIGEWVRDALA